MSRDDYGDPGAATWGNPGAVTLYPAPDIHNISEPVVTIDGTDCYSVGYIPEEAPRFDSKDWAHTQSICKPGESSVDALARIRRENGQTLGFETSPQRDYSWRELKIVSGKIEDRDTGDEDAAR